MLHTGDCVEVMASMPENSVDAIVCDPPYGIGFMAKEWDAPGGIGDFPMRRSKAINTVNTGLSRQGGRQQQGLDFQKRQAKDGRAYEDSSRVWAEQAYRVAKPGAYMLAFGGTRTVHRMTSGIEDAGWIIRDCLVWAYAQGFPKSRALLKPAWEPIVMARKPGPLRELAIDACRIPGALDGDPDRFAKTDGGTFASFTTPPVVRAEGRWPANVVLTDPIFDGDVEGVVGGGETAGAGPSLRTLTDNAQRGSDFQMGESTRDIGGDTGTYSRFFLLPKAARAEREPLITPEGHDKTKRFTTHPTIKPLDLMRHLVRLVTPSGGTVLDPFAGSGSTLIAAEMEGFAWIGIEREPEYVAIAEARLMGVQKGLGLDVPAPTPDQKTIGRQGPDKWVRRRPIFSGMTYGGREWWGDEKPEDVA